MRIIYQNVVRLLVVVAILGSLIAIAVMPASAVAAIVLVPTSGPVGSATTVTASGFVPTTILTARFDGALMETSPATVQCSPAGDATFAVMIPTSTAGMHTIAISDGVHTVTANFTVVPKVTVTAPSSKQGPVGTSVTVAGTGFSGAGVTADVTIGGMLLVSGVPVDSTGSFPGTGVVPLLPSGNKVVTAADGAGNVAVVTDVFKVTPALILTPNSGMAGSLIAISGSNWTPGSVSITFGGLAWVVVAAASDGTISAPNCRIPPSASPGVKAVAGTDGNANTASTPFTVVARPLILTPASGPRGTQVLITGSSFTPNGLIPAGSLMLSGMPWNTTAIPIDSSGVMAPTILTVPSETSIGPHTVMAIDNGSLIAVGTLTVTKPSLSVNPTSGPVNSSVTITGSGWLPGATVTINFNYMDISCVPRTISTTEVTDGDGNISTTLTVPVDAKIGTATFTASDTKNNTADPATFTVPPAAITISPVEGPAGTEVTISGTGFIPWAPVVIKIGINQFPGLPLTDALGQFWFPATIPSMTLGIQVVNATDAVQTATVFFNVLDGPTPTPITGITRQVNGDILPGVSITIDGVGPVTSDQDGYYEIMATATGNYTVTAHKDGFRDRTQIVNIAGLGQEFAVTCNFQGNYGLIPNAPDMWYALDCVNRWLYPPNPETGLDMWTALEVINAWLYPVTPTTAPTPIPTPTNTPTPGGRGLTPHQFWGNVTVNGLPAPWGVQICVTVPGVAHSFCAIVVNNGQYGYDPQFFVASDDPNTPGVKEGGVAGDVLTFDVGGVPATTFVTWSDPPVADPNAPVLFVDLGSTAVDLSIEGVIPTPTPTPTPIPTPTLTPTPWPTLTPTPTITPLPSPTQSPTPTPTPPPILILTPTPTPPPLVEILSHSSYLDTLGYYHVVGEAKNNTSNVLEFIQVTATFYNSSGWVIGTDFTFTTIDMLLPNQKSPFEVIELDTAISAQVDHYSLTIVAFTITPDEPYRAFSILSYSSSTDILGYYHVVGEVQNIGDQAATFVNVVGTFYDSTGKVVAAEFTYTSPSSLTPDQVAPFEIIVRDTTQSAKISSYMLQIQSEE